MVEVKFPGVFIEEIPSGVHEIKGVPTSTAAFLGEVARGGIKPRLATSYNDYLHWFGGMAGPDKFMPDAVKGFFENGGQRLYICRITGGAAKPAEAVFGDFTVRAADPGSWGNRVWARIDDGTTKRPDGASAGFRLRLAYWDGNTEPFDPFTSEGTSKRPQPVQVEDFDDLTLDESSPDYFGKRVPFIDLGKGSENQGPESSALGMLVRHAGVAATQRPGNGSLRLAGGTDDDHAPGPDDYRGEPNASRSEAQGLAALESKLYRDVALVYAPAASTAIAAQIIAHCERQRFRFAVIDGQMGQSVMALHPRSDLGADTGHAAFYYPWIAVSEPGAGAPRLVPPGGHCAGLYARMDTERGVFKAPAGEPLRGAVEVEFDISGRTQDDLNARGVNIIRHFPDRGIVVWGAHTLSSDPLWKYVNVRRLLIFLENSIDQGTQWVVFEPNNPRLWARVTDSIQRFLRAQWRSGALTGTTQNQAFFVRCDRTVMTEDDILNGRLVCEIGVAPVRPAEFIILRIFQSTAVTKA